MVKNMLCKLLGAVLSSKVIANVTELHQNCEIVSTFLKRYHGEWKRNKFGFQKRFIQVIIAKRLIKTISKRQNAKVHWSIKPKRSNFTKQSFQALWDHTVISHYQYDVL